MMHVILTNHLQKFNSFIAIVTLIHSTQSIYSVVLAVIMLTSRQQHLLIIIDSQYQHVKKSSIQRLQSHKN